MFTGVLPHEHGVHADHNDFTGLDRADSLTGDLSDHHAIGVSANIYASSRFGFDQLFDEFHEISTGRRYPEGLDANEFFLNSDSELPRVGVEYLRECAQHPHPLKSLANGLIAGINVATRDGPTRKVFDDGAKAVSRAIETSVEAATEPVFVFANYTDAHVPLRPIRGYDTSLYSAGNTWSTDNEAYWDVMESPEAYNQYLDHHRDLYGAAIEYLDRVVADLVETLSQVTERETTVVITADHGENLGYPEDDGLIGHKSSLSESLLHVPFLVLNAPDGYDQVETRYFSHLELRELLRGLATGETPDCYRDRIPAEVIGASPGPDPPDREEYWRRMLRCVYDGDCKFVWDSLGQVDAYHLDRDRPCWQERIVGEAEVPDWARDCFKTEIGMYRNKGATLNSEEDLDEFTKQRLEDLGYM